MSAPEKGMLPAPRVMASVSTLLLCALAGAVAIFVIIGHLLSIPLLKTPFSLAPSASLVSAFAGLAIASGLLLAAVRRHKAAVFFAAIVLVMALISALQYLGLAADPSVTSRSYFDQRLMAPISLALYAGYACALLFYSARAGNQGQLLGTAGGIGLVIGIGVIGFYGAWFVRGHQEPLLIGFPFYTTLLQLVVGLGMVALARSQNHDYSGVEWANLRAGRIGTILGAVLLIGGWAFINWSQEAYIREDAKENGANLARLLEEHVYRSLDPVDLVLRNLDAAIDRRGLAEIASSAEKLEAVRNSVAVLPQLLSVIILDAKGELQLFSRDVQLSRTNYAFRDYFQAHKAGQDVYLGQLIVTGAGALAFSYSRRLETQNGQFAGVAYAGLDIGYFSKFYESLNPDEDSTIMILRNDGQPVVRQPMVPDLVSMEFSAYEPFASYPQGPRSGNYASRSPIDNVQRLMVFRMSDELPIAVLAAQGVAPLMAKFERGFLFSSLIFASALSLLMTMRQQQVKAVLRAAKVKKAVEQNNRFVRSVMNSVAPALAVLDRDTTIVEVNSAWRDFARANGAGDSQAFVGSRYVEGCEVKTDDESDDASLAIDGIMAVNEGRSAFYEQVYPCHSPTERRWFKMRVTPMFDEPGGVVVSHENVTDLKLAEEELRHSRDQLRVVADNLPALVSYIDSGERFRFLNKTYSDWFGIDPHQSLGLEIGEVFGRERYRGIQPYLVRALAGERTSFVRQELHQDEERHFLADLIPDVREGEVLGIFGLTTDISVEKKLSLELHYRATHDSLTGLPNRAATTEEVRRAVSRAERSGQAIAVMFLDVDHFKQINDTLGHEAGDNLLKVFAGRLQQAVRKTDTVGRLAGDEFIILAEGLVSGETDAELVAENVLQILQTPAEIKGQPITISASIGITLHVKGQISAEQLIAQADAALYRAKAAGRGRYAF